MIQVHASRSAHQLFLARPYHTALDRSRGKVPSRTMTVADIYHPNEAILESLYNDLTTIAAYSTEDVILHPATRATDSSATDVVGRAAVQAWEQGLVAATNGTLCMEVEHIVANNSFGTVIGTLCARFGETAFAQPFCGLWRFRDGLIAEHWENVADPELLMTVLAASN